MITMIYHKTIVWDHFE